jgi:L-ribulokinase
VEPDRSTAGIYDELYAFYREMYFGFGMADATAIAVGEVLPGLRRIAAAVRGQA